MGVEFSQMVIMKKIKCISISNRNVPFFFGVVLLCVFTFRVPCCNVRYDFRIKTVFGSSLPPVFFVGGSCLIYVICVCLRIVVSNTYCVVFLLSLCCVSYVASFTGLCILIARSVFSNVYLQLYLLVSLF